MNSHYRKTLLILVAVAAACSVTGADILDLLKRASGPAQGATAPTALTSLSPEQMTSGLKEALAKGVQHAVQNLGKTDGFLKDSAVRIPMPENLQKIEKTLRLLRQDKLADDFVTTMNRAAEQAVPEAAGVLSNSVKQMSITDAKAILTGTNNAATQYFRRTSETNLHARFLPIVQSATEKAGVTSAYKRMTEKAGGGLGALGGSLLGKEVPNLDNYVTGKTLDGLFLKIAEQEKSIRENPAARTSDLLQKVFGSLAK